MLNRRAVLGAGVGIAATLAGCSMSYFHTLYFDPATVNEIFGSMRGVSLDPRDRAIADRVVRDGPMVQGVVNSPLTDGEYVRGPDEAVYQLSVEDVGEERRRVLHVEFDDEVDPEVAATPYEDLPVVDRPIVRDAFDAGDRYDPELSFDRHGSLVRVALAGDRRSSSAFAQGSVSAVILDGRTVAVETEWVREEVPIRRFEASRVAPDVETFLERLREDHAFELSGLTADQRDVVHGAMEDGGIGRDETDSDAFNAVRNRLQSHEPIGVGEDWLVRYAGNEYVASYAKSPDYPV